MYDPATGVKLSTNMFDYRKVSMLDMFRWNWTCSKRGRGTRATAPTAAIRRTRVIMAITMPPANGSNRRPRLKGSGPGQGNDPDGARCRAIEGAMEPLFDRRTLSINGKGGVWVQARKRDSRRGSGRSPAPSSAPSPGWMSSPPVLPARRRAAGRALRVVLRRLPHVPRYPGEDEAKIRRC